MLENQAGQKRRGRGLLLSILISAAIASIPALAPAFSFMADRQDAQRLAFPVAPSGFVVSAGDTIADRVLGQMDFVHATQNFADASTLDLSRSAAKVAIDQSSIPNRVYVADFTNNRVLGWNNAAALTNGEPANIVIGQPDPFSTACNNGGVSASSLCGPIGVAVDGSGNLYVSDSQNNRVLEYNTPFSNTGEPGSGDRIADQVFGQQENFTAAQCNQGAGKVANATTLCRPAGISIDSMGVLYIADEDNNRVLEYLFPLLSTTANDLFGQAGQFSTTVCNKNGISAESLCAPSALANDSSNNLYIADTQNSRVLEYNDPQGAGGDTTADRVFGQNNSFGTASCNGGGPAPTAKTLCGPAGLALDAANHLYIADFANSRVLVFSTPLTLTTASKVFGQGGNMATNTCNFSGNTDANGLCRPGGVALDSAGNMYVADDENSRVLKFNSAFSGDTTADVVLGQIDLAHSDLNRVDASGFGGDAADVILAGTVDISALGAVAIDHSVSPPRLYVADTHNNRVLGFNNAPLFLNGAAANVVIGQQNFMTGTSRACLPNAASSSTLCSPTGVAVDSQGNLFVADERDNRVLKFTAPVTTGKAASLVIGQSSFSANDCNKGANPSASDFCEPWSLAVDASDNLFISDTGNNRVLVFSKPAGSNPSAIEVIGQTGFTTGGCNQPGLNKFGLCEPTSAAIDPMGRLYVADFQNSRVLRYSMPLTLPVADLVYGQGATGANFSTNTCNGAAIGSTTLCNPAGVAIDSNFNLYVADTVNNRILHYNATLTGVTADLVFGQSNLSSNKGNLGGTAPNAATLSIPLWLATDGTGNLYASDAGNNRVLQYEAPLGAPSPTPTPGTATLSTSPATNPPNIKFGNVADGFASTVHKVTLTNTGAGAIIVNAVSRVGSNPTDFPQTNNCIGTLAGGKSCTINITFSPTSAAGTPEAAQFVIYDNAKNSPQLLSVYGTSSQQTTLVPGSLTYGNVAVSSTSPSQNLTLTNNRSTAIAISGLAFGGTNPGDFLKVTTCGSSLAAFGSCIVSVQFKPTALGARSAKMIFTDSASNSPQSASLAGTGTVPVTLSASSLSFGSVSTGSTSAAMTVKLTNNQSVVLNISSIALTGTEPADFQESTTCASTLAPFSTCSVSVKFKPTATGPRSATLKITDTPDAGSPHSVSLGGTGL